MELFADALSYMAGYGLKAYLITQDIRQILDQYGTNESIVSICHVRVAYAPNRLETAEVLSKMTGTKTIQKDTFNFSGLRLPPIMQHINASVDHVERALLTPEYIGLQNCKRLGDLRRSKAGDGSNRTARDERIIQRCWTTSETQNT